MKLRISIDVDNAAFADDWRGEIDYVLRALTTKIGRIGYEDHADCAGITANDSNGNRVAWVETVA